MVLNKKQIDQIKKIINNYFYIFLFKNLGSEYLSEDERKNLPEKIVTTDYFKNAFILGKIQGTTPSENRDDNLNDFETRIFNRNMGLTSTDQRSIEILKDSIVHYINNLKNRTINHIVGTIHNKNKESHIDNLGEVVHGTIEQTITEGRQIQELSTELREKTKDVARDWDRFIRTELGNAMTHGAANEITQRNIKVGIKKDDILVYKQGPLDEATCKFCKSFWHSDNSYKIYRLSELTSNGSNVGKKQANWLPTIDLTHPNCRHRLMELLPGWTLDEDGKQIYVNPDHHELNNNLSEIKKSENFKSLKGKTPTFSGHKLQNRIKFQGMDISIENRKGSYRKWKDRNGNSGKTKMLYDYGYIRNTLANDNDHLDVYIGKNNESKKVFIVKQIVPKTKKFDEYKTFLGFDSINEAKKAYLAHIPKEWFGKIVEIDLDKFKNKILGKNKPKLIKSINLNNILDKIKSK